MFDARICRRTLLRLPSLTGMCTRGFSCYSPRFRHVFFSCFARSLGIFWVSSMHVEAISPHGVGAYDMCDLRSLLFHLDHASPPFHPASPPYPAVACSSDLQQVFSILPSLFGRFVSRSKHSLQQVVPAFGGRLQLFACWIREYSSCHHFSSSMPNDKTVAGAGEVDGGGSSSSQGLLSPDALLELLSFLPHPEVRF